MNDIEKAAYQRGYQAGKRRKQREISREREYRERQAFLDRCYLALLPAAMMVDGWTIGNEKINTGDQRCKLAAAWAKHAVIRRPFS